jgi:hypothetical protein
MNETRKIGFLMMIGALALTGCSPMSVIGSGEARGGGKGRVIVSVSDGKTSPAASARTALPTLPGGFKKVKLSFIPVTGGLTVPDPVEMSGATQEVNLQEGEWKIRAGGVKDGTELAHGEASVLIEPGAEPVSLTIPVTIPTAGDDGIWNYEVTYPDSDIQAITMTVTDYTSAVSQPPVNLKDGGSVSLSTANAKTTASGALSLAPGYYVMKLTATRSGRDINRLDVIHVYSAVDGTETTSAYEITGSDFLTTISGVAITAADGTAAPNQIARTGDAVFKATVTGTGTFNTDIIWTITPIGGAAGIDFTPTGPQTTANGTSVTVHADAAATLSGTFKVRAASAQDLEKYREVTVTIVPGTGQAGAGISKAPEVEAALALTAIPAETGGFVTVAKGATVTVSATACDTYSWFLNGDPQTGSGNGVAVDTAALEKGVYQLDFIGEIKGSSYSKSLKIKVE